MIKSDWFEVKKPDFLPIKEGELDLDDIIELYPEIAGFLERNIGEAKIGDYDEKRNLIFIEISKVPV